MLTESIKLGKIAEYYDPLSSLIKQCQRKKVAQSNNLLTILQLQWIAG